MNFWATGSRFFSKMDFLQADMVEQNYLKDYAVKTSFEWYLRENLNFKFGGEHKFLFVDYDQEWDQGKILVNREMQHSSGFVSMVWNPSIRWQVEAVGQKRDGDHFGMGFILIFKNREQI